MEYRKTTIILLIISALAIFITGCTYDIDLGIEGVLKITLNKDYSADTEINLLINSSDLDIIGIAVNPLIELKNELESQGYKTKVYVKGDKTGLYAYKHIENIEDLSIPASNILEYKHINQIQDIKISKEKSLFYDIYTVKTNIDLLSQIDDYNISKIIPLNSIIEQINLKFILDLPFSVVEHNASRISEDNRVLEWDIISTMNNLIEFKFRIPNRDRIILVSIIGICLLLLIYLLSRKSTLDQ